MTLSHSPLRCVRACTYPGSVVGGRLRAPVKFFYRVGETVAFECTGGRKARGSKRIECLETGMWSASVPLCVEEE